MSSSEGEYDDDDLFGEECYTLICIILNQLNGNRAMVISDIIAPLRVMVLHPSIDDCDDWAEPQNEDDPSPSSFWKLPRQYLSRRALFNREMPKPTAQVLQVANRVVSYARSVRNDFEENFSCGNCGFIPNLPVTGLCGHTRCDTCIRNNSRCPCGASTPREWSTNILLRDIIHKMLADRCNRVTLELANSTADEPLPSTSDSGNSYFGNFEPQSGPMRNRKLTTRNPTSQIGSIQDAPISPRARYVYAIKKIDAREFGEAVPHLALVAASQMHQLRSPARSLLAQVITKMTNGQDPRRIHIELNRSIRRECSNSWIKLEDMECILCCDTFMRPVTTPCGHTFCRGCLERTMVFRKRCPICRYTLQGIDLRKIRNTAFIGAALATMDGQKELDSDDQNNVIPIFVCTVAYPSVPCPLLIFDRRYWAMVRQVLESTTREFGMVARGENYNYADCGTILQVRDCVQMEDGSCILSTVGVSRFTMEEILTKNGFEMARVKRFLDVYPEDLVEVKKTAAATFFKAVRWIRQLDIKLLADIEDTFGAFPLLNTDIYWWTSADGPMWTWWLIAVLPLNLEIKLLILSSNSLLKRLEAVKKTIDTLESRRIRLT